MDKNKYSVANTWLITVLLVGFLSPKSNFK